MRNILVIIYTYEFEWPMIESIKVFKTFLRFSEVGGRCKRFEYFPRIKVKESVKIPYFEMLFNPMELFMQFKRYNTLISLVDIIRGISD